jgi:hypothetical protein
MSIAGCGPVSPQLGTVVFDPVAFISQYPEFSTIPQPALQRNFVLATQFLSNNCASAVKDAPTREVLLFLLVAHFTKLLNGDNTNPATGVVGRVSEAQQGSVRVRSEMGGSRNTTELEAWYLQTQYGATFWTATAQYRTMRYFAPPRRQYVPNYFGYGNDGATFTGGFGNGDGNGNC